MTNSTLIARLMGPLLLILGFGMLIGLLGDGAAEYMNMLRNFMADIPLIIVFGMLTLVAGLAIVNAHNLWVTNWRVIITVLGWLAIIRGIVAILFPVRIHEIGETVMATPTGPTTGAIIILVLGGILCWMGYEELCRADKRRPAAARSTTPRKRSSSATRKKPRRRTR